MLRKNTAIWGLLEYLYKQFNQLRYFIVSQFCFNAKTEIENKEWRDSQVKELDYWRTRIKDDGEPDTLQLYFKEFKNYTDYTRDKILADIGFGPRSILNFSDSKISIAIDPLMSKYKESGYSFAEQEFIPVEAKGEEVPLPDNSVDYVFSTNALDHCEDATGVFNEMVRILKPGGRICLGVHLRHTRALTDDAHKMWFSSKFIESLIDKNKLKIIFSTISDKKRLAWGERRFYIGIFEKS